MKSVLIVVTLMLLACHPAMAGRGRGRGGDTGGGGRGRGGETDGGGRGRGGNTGGGGRGRGGGTRPVCDPVECDADPCEGATCYRFPRAKCRPNYCEGCDPQFFVLRRDVTEWCDVCKDLGDAVSVECSKNNTCPGTALCDDHHKKCCCGEEKFACFSPPCDSATCPNHPDAKCV